MIKDFFMGIGYGVIVALLNCNYDKLLKTLKYLFYIQNDKMCSKYSIISG